MNELTNSPQNKWKSPTDEVNIAQLILILWSYRKWITACTTLVTLAGILYVLFASPRYHAEAEIALKGEDKGNATTRVLAQLSGMGGSFSGQLGTGGMSLDKVQIILKGHELAESLIVKNDLMPILFPKLWDPNTNAWKVADPKKIPTTKRGVGILRQALEVSISQKSGTLTVGINTYDPKLASKLVECYLAGLNEKLRLNVVNDAESNQNFLEKELDNTVDPELRGVIHSLIASEMQKQMLVSSNAFDVLEGPVVPTTAFSPNRKKIVMLSFLAGIVLSSLTVFVWKGILGLRTAVVRESRL